MTCENASMDNDKPNDGGELFQFLVPPLTPGVEFTLVLDLDETLVHARGESVLVRPYLDLLSMTLSTLNCEVIMWTAGTHEHVNKVMPYISSLKFDHIITRNDRWYKEAEGGKAEYTKDLTLLGRRLDKVVIVDNSPSCVYTTPFNSIVVKSFTGKETADEDLFLLSRNVIFMFSNCSDVRCWIHNRNDVFHPEYFPKSRFINYFTMISD